MTDGPLAGGCLGRTHRLRSQSEGIAAGPDGNVWFAEYLANMIGRITTAEP